MAFFMKRANDTNKNKNFEKKSVEKQVAIIIIFSHINTYLTIICFHKRLPVNGNEAYMQAVVWSQNTTIYCISPASAG